MKAKNRSGISADESAVKAESVASLRPQIATRARRLRLDDVIPPLILTPAMIASIIFVYAFIAITIWVSLSKWGTLRPDLNLREPFGFTYQQMFSMPRWHASLRNMFIFTALFLTGSIFFGLVLALLLDRKLIGHSILRNVFLFPYALWVALNNLSGSFSVDWNVVMAGAVVAALPTALVYIFLGRFFVRGLLAGSVKG
jgi:ABC-type sugar transport system permease subunit